MTKKQLQSSMDMMRGVCAPKHKVSVGERRYAIICLYIV